MRANPSLKRNANGRPPGPPVRGAFFASLGLVAYCRRPLARTLGQRAQELPWSIDLEEVPCTLICQCSP